MVYHLPSLNNMKKIEEFYFVERETSLEGGLKERFK
jgi:hypothetical protein